MNCPICSHPLLLLREGKPPGPGSIRNFWVNLWACEKCDKVFPPECVFIDPHGNDFVSPRTTQEDREKRLLNKAGELNKHSPYSNLTLVEYQEVLKKNLSGNTRDEDTAIAWPSEGNEIYVPTMNGLVVGGLATIEISNNGGPRMGWTKKASEWCQKHLAGYFICVEEHPGHEYLWEELAPRQKELQEQFGSQRAQLILPADNDLHIGDEVYIPNSYLWTEYYRNKGETDEGYEYVHFSDLPDNKSIPVITYEGGGIATISRLSADIDENGKEYCRFQTQERVEYSWYNWQNLAGRQDELKKKFGGNRAPKESAYHQSIDVRPDDYDKVFFELFGYKP